MGRSNQPVKSLCSIDKSKSIEGIPKHLSKFTIFCIDDSPNHKSSYNIFVQTSHVIVYDPSEIKFMFCYVL